MNFDPDAPVVSHTDNVVPNDHLNHVSPVLQDSGESWPESHPKHWSSMASALVLHFARTLIWISIIPQIPRQRESAGGVRLASAIKYFSAFHQCYKCYKNTDMLLHFFT